MESPLLKKPGRKVAWCFLQGGAVARQGRGCEGEADQNLSWPFVNSLCVRPYSTLVINLLHDFTAVVMERSRAHLVVFGPLRSAVHGN